MAKKKFSVTFIVTAEIELDEQVISVVDDDWRNVFYDFYDDIDIVEHIAYNMLRNDASLSEIDGWGDQPNSNATLVGGKWELDDCEPV